MKIVKRISAAAVALLLMTLSCIYASAMDIDYSVSSGYKNTKYYNNIREIPKVEDERTAVVSAALSQLGYNEGNMLSETDGSNKGGSLNYNEYSFEYGKVDGNGDGTPEWNYEWCAAFVTWCLRRANISERIAASYVSCTLWVEWFMENSEYHTRLSSYVPSSGDIIFFKDYGSYRNATHVGIVVYTEGEVIYTVEGNSSNRVRMNSYKIDDLYIAGYGVPDYERNAESATDYSDERQTGYYINSSTGTLFEIAEIDGALGRKADTDSWVDLDMLQLVLGTEFEEEYNQDTADPNATETLRPVETVPFDSNHILGAIAPDDSSDVDTETDEGESDSSVETESHTGITDSETDISHNSGANRPEASLSEVHDERLIGAATCLGIIGLSVAVAAVAVSKNKKDAS